MKVFKRPDQVVNPFATLPTKESDYDSAIEEYLNGIDPSIHEDGMDYGQGFIDSAYDLYEDAPEGYKIPTEHHNYIHNKVADLINNKYDYLKPYFKKLK